MMKYKLIIIAFTLMSLCACENSNNGRYQLVDSENDSPKVLDTSTGTLYIFSSSKNGDVHKITLEGKYKTIDYTNGE